MVILGICNGRGRDVGKSKSKDIYMETRSGLYSHNTLSLVLSWKYNSIKAAAWGFWSTLAEPRTSAHALIFDFVNCKYFIFTMLFF